MSDKPYYEQEYHAPEVMFQIHLSEKFLKDYFSIRWPGQRVVLERRFG